MCSLGYVCPAYGSSCSGEGTPLLIPRALVPCAWLLSELGVGVYLTFLPGSTGERLPVIPAAVCHNSPGQPPSSTLAFLNKAPDCVQGTADLERQPSTLITAARELPCWAVWARGGGNFLPCGPPRALGSGAGRQQPLLLRGLVSAGRK